MLLVLMARHWFALDVAEDFCRRADGMIAITGRKVENAADRKFNIMSAGKCIG